MADQQDGTLSRESFKKAHTGTRVSLGSEDTESMQCIDRLDTCLQSPKFDALLLGVLLFNLGLTVVEANKRADGGELFLEIRILVWLCLFFYSVEIVCRVYTYRWKFFCDRWNIFDLTIVSTDLVIGLLDIIYKDLPPMSVLRIIRIVRLVRAVRILSGARELYIMLHGMLSAFRSIAWGTCLLGLALIIWSILAVELIHPINSRMVASGAYSESCIRCPHAFDSVWNAMLTVLKWNLAGGWDEVFFTIAEEEPWTVVLFIMMLISLTVGLLNLVLTAIVDRAHDARAEDEIALLEQKEQDLKKAKKMLYRVCTEMDVDKSGALEIDELRQGYDNHEEFRRILSLMDVTKDDLFCVFGILDEDGSGDITYDEFVDQLYKMKQQNQHTLLVFIRYHVVQCRIKLQEQMIALGRTVKLQLSEQDKLIKDFILQDAHIEPRTCLLAPTELSLSTEQKTQFQKDKSEEGAVAPLAQVQCKTDATIADRGPGSSGTPRCWSGSTGSTGTNGKMCSVPNSFLPSEPLMTDQLAGCRAQTGSRPASSGIEGFRGQIDELRTTIQRDFAEVEKATQCCVQGFSVLRSYHEKCFAELGAAGMCGHAWLPGTMPAETHSEGESDESGLFVHRKQLQATCAELAGQAEKLLSSHVDEALLLRNLSRTLLSFSGKANAGLEASKGGQDHSNWFRLNASATMQQDLGKLSTPDHDEAFQKPLPPTTAPPRLSECY